MNYDINTFQKARETQNNIGEKEQAERQRFDEERRKISNAYYDLKSKLDAENRQKEHNAEIKNQKVLDTLKQKRADADEKGEELYRIFNFMELLKKDDFDKNKFEVYIYDYPRDEKGDVKHILKDNCWRYPEKEQVFIAPIDTLHDDEYLKLNVYIGDTDKPKNKKKLFVVGKSILASGIHNSNVIKLPNDYGINTHTNGNDIQKSIIDLPTEKELLEYYEKNKTKILKDFIQEHKNAVAELEEVKTNTTNKDWEIFYLEHKKERYEKSYSRFENDEGYLKVCNELEKLKSRTN